VIDMIHGQLPTNIEIDRMAWKIAELGVQAVPAPALRELGFQARMAGIQPVLTEVLIDQTAPPVARQRAFGQIAAQIAQWHIGDLATSNATRPETYAA
jgi:hypothetical protein